MNVFLPGCGQDFYLFNRRLLTRPRPLLLRMHREGWVQFLTTDTALTEATSAADPAVGERLFNEISTGWISGGPFVLDHSRPDIAMLPSDDDQARLDQVHQLIWGHLWAEDAEATGRTPRTRIRDTMHVATAIRYNGYAFVTDDEAVQRAAAAIGQQFGTRIWSPGAGCCRAGDADRSYAQTLAARGLPARAA